MKTFLSITILSVFLFSCERDLDIKVPPHESRLVINAQWQQDSLFVASISRSRGVLENTTSFDNRYLVKNALVAVKENGVAIDTLKYDSVYGRYISAQKRASLAKSYVIEATAPGFPKASGSATMPYIVKTSGVLVERSARISQGGDVQSRITVTFQDSTPTNYYVFRIKKDGNNFEYYCVQTNDRDIERKANTDPFSTDVCYDNDELLFSDKNFNGKEKKIIFFVSDYLFQSYTVNQRVIRPWLELQHVNEDYFRYIKSVANYNSVADFPFAEPVNVINNIQNGYGFFTVFSASVDTLR